MKRLAKKQKWGPFLALLLLLCLAGVAAADPYVGDIPLETVQSGTVSGGVYVDANNDWWPSDPGVQDVEKTFATIPNVNDIDWARLYVSVYCGHMQNNYQGTAAISFDGDGDGTYETALGTETMNVPYTFPHDGGSGPVKVNDHMNRVTSDYLMWYDVTSLITSQTPKAHVVTSALDGSFDGRIKVITLVVAYNDGDTDTIYYWVNQGHDTDTYYDTTGYIGSTNFDLSSLSGTVQSATLTVNHMASSDGTYAWGGDPIDSDPATGNFQGSYFGYNIWDVTSATTFGDIYDLTYNLTDQFYKIPLAVLAVKKAPSYVSPVADFSATPLSGTTPLNVQFTDLSTGPPTTWKWEYRLGSGSWTQFSTEQHPFYTFISVGSYRIRLTVTNPVLPGGNTNTSPAGYITVSAPANPDLTITDLRPVTNTPFAKETNTVKITVKNIGGVESPATTVNLISNDGFSGSASVPALASNAETVVSILDTTVRDIAGGSLTYTGTVDPSNTVTESNEGNNVVANTYTVAYNGYKGKRFWAGASDVTTKKTFDLHGNLLYSPGDSTYRSGGVGASAWNDYTVTWTAADLPVPSGATIREARLYVPYTWDNTNEVPDRFSATFNGHLLPDDTLYTDKSNFGGYANHVYGLLAYDVTPYFTTGGNSVVIHKDAETSNLAMYGLTLAVVYEKADEPRRQIFMNEEFDLLGADENNYATTPEEATAYVPFSGLSINPANVASASLITFVPSGNGPEGILLFNGNTLGTNVWDYGSVSGTQVAVDTRDVKSYLSGTNEAGIQSTAGATPAMAAAQQFLVLTYTEAAPVAGFTGTPTSGDAPLEVQFTDASIGSITSRSWEYRTGGGSWTQFSTDVNPSYTFTAAGTYDIRLTVNGPGGSDPEEKQAYITVTEMAPPVAQFTASTTNGLAPLSVTFTDTSTGNPTAWKWEYRNYDGSWTEFSTVQSPTQSFSTPGTYDIRLTVSKGAMSDDETKTHLFAVSGGREPLTTVASGTVSGDLYVGAFQTVPFGNQPASGITFREFDQPFSIPSSAVRNIQWARLFVTTYSGSASNSYGHRQTISFDGNGDAVYETTLGVEDCDIAAEGNGNSYPLNDHVTKVFSDYEAWYDVTGLITATNPAARIRTEQITGKSYDGRLKAVTLVVAYNDGDTDQVKYWVNHGHDWINSGTTQTTFDTSSVTAGFTNATGRNLATSSKDGRYTFNGVAQSWADPVPPVNYFDFNIWDLKATNSIIPGSGSTLVYEPASGQSFKTVLSTVTVRYATPAPVADFTPASPVTGDKPLTVEFTDASTGSITTWDMDFGDGSPHGSGPGPWSHTYTARGTYDVSLTVTGPGGSDTKTKTGHIQVMEPAPNVDFTFSPASGVEPLTVNFNATNSGGAVTSWKWEYSADGTTWTQFATTEDASFTFSNGTWSVRVTATGPDYSDTETKLNIISVGASSMTVTVSPGSIDFGTMQAGVDETGSSTVSVDVTGGTAWSVTASANNGGYMSTGTVNLANPFQLSKTDGSGYQAMTSSFADFLTGAAGVDGSGTAFVKQAIAASDAPGSYSITLTFTGGFV
ncbi:MAG TPA: DUF3344 domain-containing protein [Methanolinea sp.]|nr:DUF3344 domain-containing protein [Methanolinea sp.]